jgi:hypothetical protein
MVFVTCWLLAAGCSSIVHGSGHDCAAAVRALTVAAAMRLCVPHTRSMLAPSTPMAAAGCQGPSGLQLLCTSQSLQACEPGSCCAPRWQRSKTARNDNGDSLFVCAYVRRVGSSNQAGQHAGRGSGRPFQLAKARAGRIGVLDSVIQLGVCGTRQLPFGSLAHPGDGSSATGSATVDP